MLYAWRRRRKEKRWTREDVSSRDCEHGGSICFHLSHALFVVKEKEKKEVDIGIVVTLPLVVEWTTIKRKHRVDRRG